jgi:uncharacterized protein with von Willebrand factor type A (vWA) domain
MAASSEIAVSFGRVLRGAGVSVPVGSLLTFAEAIGTVGVSRRDPVYWAGRATLLRRPEDIDTYDIAFEAFWNGGLEQRSVAVAEPEVVSVQLGVDAAPEGDDQGGGEGDGDGDTVALRFSAISTMPRLLWASTKFGFSASD